MALIIVMKTRKIPWTNNNRRKTNYNINASNTDNIGDSVRNKNSCYDNTVEDPAL